ncbi:MAG: ABC transporter substrate-binding protein [Gemmatimonadaceae bacterium]
MTATPGGPCLRRLLLGALAGPLALTLGVACAREGARRAPRTLVAAIGGDPGHLNPAITTNGGVHTAAALLYDGLLTLDEQLQPQPALATRWEVEDGGARYVFHLRPGVRWHDGQPFTAADVEFTFTQVLLKFHARTRASLGPALAGVRVLDDSTVEFRFRRPYAPLLQQLDMVEAPIIPRHVFAGGDPLRNPANTAPVGTGPFRFVSYRAGSEIRYAANKDYFLGAPWLEAVVLRIIPDPATQVIALEAGEVDYLFAVPGPERERLRRDPRVRLLQATVNPGGSNCITTLGFNLDRPFFRDLRVRRAVAHAVNRDQIVERVLFGEGRAADAPISSRIAFAHAAGLPILAWDTARAAALLDSAGWTRGAAGQPRVARGVRGVADGTAFAIGLTVLPSQANYGDLLRAQLRAVGIDLRVEPLEQAVFSQAVFTARDFDTAIGAYCNGTDPEIGVRRMLVSSNVAPVPFSNMAGYRNPVVDSLFERAASALDPGERRRLYREIQELVVRDQPYVWLVETIATRAHSVRCHGFETSAHFAARARCGE